MTSIKTKGDSILFCNLSDEDITHFTGFSSCSHFQEFIEQLINFEPNLLQNELVGFVVLGKPASQGLPNCYKLAAADQLVLTLMKIKHNYEDLWIKTLYKLSDFSLKEIFKIWTNSIFKYFQTLNFWDNRVILKDNFTCVICTLNIRFRQGKQIKSQKHLIALDSKSNVCFNSQLYSQDTPNQQILIESGILDKLDPLSDIVSIDKGYNALDLLKSRRIQMTIPKSQKSDSTQPTVYKVKQNRITMDILQLPEEELSKVVMVSNMIFSYIRLTE